MLLSIQWTSANTINIYWICQFIERKEGAKNFLWISTQQNFPILFTSFSVFILLECTWKSFSSSFLKDIHIQPYACSWCSALLCERSKRVQSVCSINRKKKGKYLSHENFLPSLRKKFTDPHLFNILNKSHCVKDGRKDRKIWFQIKSEMLTKMLRTFFIHLWLQNWTLNMKMCPEK